MISLSHLNKILFIITFFILMNLGSVFAEEEAIDIWKKNESENQQKDEPGSEESLKIESPILSDDSNNTTILISEDSIKDDDKPLIGIFDPQENNLNLNMWSNSDGEEIKKIFNRINKLKLSGVAEDLLFQILFTNAYAPEKNLNSDEFTKIKVNWLIKEKRIDDLETLLKNNSEVRQNSTAINFLINEYLSSADIKSACDKMNFLDSKIQNIYLEKFMIYCLINNDRKDEAQLIFDLLRETGMKDKFFEEKINYLLGVSNTSTQKILDDNLFNFYLSHITSDNFDYMPTDKTDNYIWRYMSSANLIQVNDFENDDVILTYEQAAAKNSFDKDEIFKIYLKINFNFNQLINSNEIYKNLPNYKARALIYQSMMLSDNLENKINLAFLLKDLFIKDNLLNVYKEELSDILKSIDPNKIPEGYTELVKENTKLNSSIKVKFDNDILHRSKVIKHFLDNNEKINRTEKDFKSVYKKIKKNKKYFISIKDIVVLESLEADGVSIPADLNYTSLSSELTIPKNLQELVDQNQLGLVMLKIVEIIGEDKVSDLDPETIYFLNKILNQLNLKKIRNHILSEALPQKA